MSENHRFLQDDARNLLDHVDPNSIDTIITSPPYHDLKDYGHKDQIGKGQEYEQYLTELKNIFKDCYEATEPTGSLWLVVDTFKKEGEIKLLPFDLANRLTTDKVDWELQDIIIWDKKKTLPWHRKGEFPNKFEYILFFTKSKNDFKFYLDRIKESNPLEFKKWWIRYPERYNPKGKTPKNIWEFQIPTQGSWGTDYLDHFCPFPPKLVKRIITLTTNEDDLVADPFAGSGMVLAQAEAMNRKCIGLDLNEDYIERYNNGFKEKIIQRYKNKNKKLKQGKFDEKLHKLKELKRKISEEIDDLEKHQNLDNNHDPDEEVMISKRIQKIAKKIENISDIGDPSFENKIMKLRKLKYPRTLVNRVKSNKNIECIFVLSDEGEKQISEEFKFLEVELYLIFSSQYEDKDEKKFKEATQKPPLSKFGISSELNFSEKSDINKVKQRVSNFSDEWYVYTGGNTHKFYDEMNNQELNELFNDNNFGELKENGYPPIISNIKIYIKEDKYTYED